WLIDPFVLAPVCLKSLRVDDNGVDHLARKRTRLDTKALPDHGSGSSAPSGAIGVERFDFCPDGNCELFARHTPGDSQSYFNWFCRLAQSSETGSRTDELNRKHRS